MSTYRENLLFCVGCGIPIPGLTQSLLEIHHRFIVENLPAARDVRLGVKNIARTGRVVPRANGPSADFPQQFQHFIERDAKARSSVKHLSGSSRSFTGAQRSVHNIIYKCEIAGFLAAAIY